MCENDVTLGIPKTSYTVNFRNLLEGIIFGKLTFTTGQSRYYASIGVHESHSQYARDAHYRVQKKIYFFF